MVEKAYICRIKNQDSFMKKFLLTIATLLYALLCFAHDPIISWNYELKYEANNTVMVHIRRIREKIELDSRNAQIIKTVWGVGYKIDR